MKPSVTATVLRLPDERDLAYAEYGDPNGIPVFGFHGTPGSRAQVGPNEEMPVPPGVRIIAPDRPGYGLSSFQTGRRLTDWPGDVAAIAEHLGLERFGVFGISGGGPHALVCAHGLGERLLGAACVSGVGPLGSPEAAEGMMPMNRVITRLGRTSPLLLRLLMALQGLVMRRFADSFFDRFIAQLPAPDQEIIRRPAIRKLFVEDAARASATSGRAAAQDFEIFIGDWGFRLEDIRIPVHFWQGDLDRNVPAAHVRLLADPVPDARLHTCPGEGHLLAFDRLPEILAAATGKSS